MDCIRKKYVDKHGRKSNKKTAKNISKNEEEWFFKQNSELLRCKGGEMRKTIDEAENSGENFKGLPSRKS